MTGDWRKRLDAMTMDEMFALHLDLRGVLEERLKSRRAEIDRRLEELDRPADEGKGKRRG